MAGGHNPWIVALVVSLATFMEVLDTSIANVSLTHIAGSLSASVDESTWVLTSYLVANAIVLPISGWLATVIGRKRFYMGCVALFTISSTLCGMATSLELLIVFRVLQGLGGGGLAPSEQSILADSFPEEKRGMAFSLYGVAVVVAPAVGPTLGGWITDNYSWHWIFLINLPVGVLSLVLTYFVLKEPAAEKQRRCDMVKHGLKIDYVGFGLVAIGLGALQVVLDKGEREDWFASHFIVAFTWVSAVALVTLIVWELWQKEPIVDLPLLKNRSFAAANVVMFAMGFILFGTTELLPQFVQQLLGYTATLAGEVITPGGFAVMLVMPVVGWLLGRIQPRLLVACGLIIEFYALGRMTNLDTDAPYSELMWDRIIQAMGIAFLFVPISTAAYIGLPPGKNNNASALVNLFRNLGGSFGISLAQTWLARRSQLHQERIVSHLTPYDSLYRSTVDSLTGALASNGTAPVQAHQQALGVIYQMVQQQAQMLAFIDVFWLLSWASLLLVPIVFLLKKAPKGQRAAMH
jgi:DHA2 family multidrug resistance protein